LTVYFDSSALVAAYVTEAYSGRARRELRRRVPVPWTPLHDVEVKNALRLLCGRKQINEAELNGLLAHIDEDLHRGRLLRPILDLDAMFRRAERLSHTHAMKTLARTLDLLHVAALMEIGCGTLASGDERQIAAARSEGLRTIDIRSAS
jgi:predicted nucleic acid-binding protein